jgi:ankyrin repeat protein
MKYTGAVFRAFLVFVSCNVIGCSKVDFARLSDAVRVGNTNSISDFVQAKRSIDAQIPRPFGQGSETLLHLAAREGRLEFVRALIERGANVNATNSAGKTALDQVIASDENGSHRPIFEFLLQSGASVSVVGRDGWNALITASHSGEEWFVNRLLEAGADPRTHDSSLDTPLHLARTARVVALLAEAGGQINITNLRGQTPLDMAERYGTTRAAAEELRKRGATNNVLTPGKGFSY